MVVRMPLSRLPYSMFAASSICCASVNVARLGRATPSCTRQARPRLSAACTVPGWQQRHRSSLSVAAVTSADLDTLESNKDSRRSHRRSRRTTRADTRSVEGNQQRSLAAAGSTSNKDSSRSCSVSNAQQRAVSDMFEDAALLPTNADLTNSAGLPSSSYGSESATNSRTSRTNKRQSNGNSRLASTVHSAHVIVRQPLPRVLMLHTGGTLGMDVSRSFDVDPEDPHQLSLKKGTGGSYGGLVPGDMLANLFQQVPELSSFANLDLQVVFNKDSSNVGPKEWMQIARLLDKNRQQYDAFLVVHGTDTMAYTASALSLMLLGFRKPIVMTGSQLPLSSPRSDARQNLIDALTCATAAFKPPHVNLSEVAVCFGGKLMRGNRAQKVDSSSYQAFDSPGYPHLATLGVGVDWNDKYLLRTEGNYRPRFKLEPLVIRIPIVPGSDPRICYGDLVERGVRGIVLEAFGVGNMPDLTQAGWIPWLRQQTKKGLQVYMSSQCHLGPLHPEIYKAGAMALEMGVEAGPQMTPECAVVKMMLCLAYPDIPVGVPLAGEM